MGDLRRDLLAAYSIGFIILIAVLLVSASTVAILLYQGEQSEQSPAIAKATWGKAVKVDYIGRLVDGRVFDTSLWTVASNDALYPKSLSFTLRNQSSYTPLEFTIGSGQMIPGFERGVIGMVEGETKVIEVAPADGYGELNLSRLEEIPLLDSIPVFEVMNITEFIDEFSAAPKVGLTVSDPMWGWPVSVLEVNTDANRVRVMNSPVLGAEYKVYGNPEATPSTGWYAEVVYFDSSANGGAGLIQVRHGLDKNDEGYVKGVGSFGSFIVLEVSESGNKIVLNYNSEVTGVTLYFTVTLVDIA